MEVRLGVPDGERVGRTVGPGVSSRTQALGAHGGLKLTVTAWAPVQSISCQLMHRYVCMCLCACAYMYMLVCANVCVNLVPHVSSSLSHLY